METIDVGRAWRYLGIYFEALESAEPFVTRLGDETANPEFTKRLVSERKKLKKWAEKQCFRTMTAPNPEPGTMRVVDDPEPFMFAYLTVSDMLDKGDPRWFAVAYKQHKKFHMSPDEWNLFGSVVESLALRIGEGEYEERTIVQAVMQERKRIERMTRMAERRQYKAIKQREYRQIAYAG